MKEATKRLLTKEVKLFERSIPVFLILIVALAGTGAAAVLSTYGSVAGTADVSQSVLVNGETYDQSPQFEYSYNSAVGGDLKESSTTVQNNAGSPAPVTISTTEDAGMSTSYIFYDQWALDGGDDDSGDDTSYDVRVEASTQEVVEGDYSLHFTSDGTASNDYARAFFEVGSTLDGTESVSYRGVATGDAPVEDEIWLVTADGSQYFANLPGSTSDGSTVTVDEQLDTLNWAYANQTPVDTPRWADVTTFGIGQGGPTSAGVTVDTTIDNIDLGGSSLDEQAPMDVAVLPTGDFPEFGLQSQYVLDVVTAFDIAVQPDTYTITTSVAPQ